MANEYLLKHPNEVLDYSFDWSAGLASGDSIATTSTVVNPIEVGGLVIDSGGSTVTANVVSPLISGGVRGRRYEVINQIVTAQGRTDEQRRTILVG